MSTTNGHAKPEARKSGRNRERRYRERKRKGLILLPHVELTPQTIEALTALGWLHTAQKNDRDAIRDSLAALCHEALSAGMKPVQPGRVAVQVPPQAIEDASVWLKPGTEMTPERAGVAIGTAVTCAAIAGFTPQVYSDRMKQMLADRKNTLTTN